ncbi:DASS family sodium-coupled anion symporter [Marinitoga sp. 38H-ov]|uniref:SLC13 family permease n=1 Tax=Marinitoga sp. 38H-ov TaxID=1755814 RepID=UPI0013EC2B5F|nr:DASS family sodium-coupled anion symporter [Marinitoga sp. 38H-ov]KAF2956274.1 hypothetical protein AS160_00315 [Marinitoga sp. 38H-ov]
MKRKIIFLITIILFSLPFITNPPEGLDSNGYKSLVIFLVSILWWSTKFVPLMITSILSIISFPLLGIQSSAEVYSKFGNSAVFFVLGSFILASAMIRSGLSKRIALKFLVIFGKTPLSLVLSFQYLAIIMSFWTSGHAVAAMLMPIVLEIGNVLYEQENGEIYLKFLTLSSMWGSIIGSGTTLLGGARGPLAIAMLKKITGINISFTQWIISTLPIVISVSTIASIIIIKNTPKNIDISKGINLLKNKNLKLSKLSQRELYILTILIITMIMWISFGTKMGIANIALLSVIILFIFRLISWNEVEKDVNWGIILMYGGAIAMGSTLAETGVSTWIMNLIPISNSLLFLVLIIIITVLFTEFMSNTAVVAFLLPIVLSTGLSLNILPQILVFSVVLPAGFAFMLPMSTPAVAIMLSTNYIDTKDTIKYGIILNITGIIATILSILIYWPILYK